MGIRYCAIIAIGKEFEDEIEALGFLHDNGYLLSEQDEINIENDGLSECLSGINLDGDCLDYYSGNGYYLGFDINCSNPDKFKSTYEKGIEEWSKLFPTVEYRIIKTVQTY